MKLAVFDETTTDDVVYLRMIRDSYGVVCIIVVDEQGNIIKPKGDNLNTLGSGALIRIRSIRMCGEIHVHPRRFENFRCLVHD